MSAHVLYGSDSQFFSRIPARPLSPQETGPTRSSDCRPPPPQATSTAGRLRVDSDRSSKSVYPGLTPNLDESTGQSRRSCSSRCSAARGRCICTACWATGTKGRALGLQVQGLLEDTSRGRGRRGRRRHSTCKRPGTWAWACACIRTRECTSACPCEEAVRGSPSAAGDELTKKDGRREGGEKAYTPYDPHTGLVGRVSHRAH